MKIYRFNKVRTVPFIVLGLLCFLILLFDRESFSWDIKIGLIISSITMPIIYLYLLHCAIVTDEEQISWGMVSLNNKKFRYKRQLKWLEIDKVLQFNKKVYVVYPKVAAEELYKFYSTYSIRIPIYYKNYEEILKEVTQRAKNAQVDDGVRRAIAEWERKKNNTG